MTTPKPVELAWPPKTLVDAKEGEAVSPTETLVREESLVSTFITLEDPKEAAAAVPSPELLLLLLSMVSAQETYLTDATEGEAAGPETVVLEASLVK